jgi:HlyD family secretion protein
MGRPVWWALLAGLALAGGGLVWYLTRPTPVRVLVARADRGPVEATVANTRAGTVEACRRARMSPALGGQVARLPVREGAFVRTGQVLLELWNDDLRAEIVLAEREIAATEARATEACTVAEVAQREADRLVRLRKQGVASEETTESAVGEAKARDAGCRAVRTSAQVSAARRDAALAALERTFLRAPFDGVVAEVNGEVGEFVTPSPVGIPTPPTIDLIDTTCLYVKAPIDEVDAGHVAPGLPARISLDAFPGRDFPGRVERVAPYVLDREKQARTVDVEVQFDPLPVIQLLVGYSADVEITLEKREETLRIPSEALREGHRVLTFGDDAVLQERSIEPGLANWEFTEVMAGLDQGEQVVLSVDREGVEAGVEAEVEITASAGDPSG